MFGNLLQNSGDYFDKAMGGWLQYEAIKHGADFSGQSQNDLYNTPQTTAPAPVIEQAAEQPKEVFGVPVAYLAIGAAALVGVGLLLKD